MTGIICHDDMKVVYHSWRGSPVRAQPLKFTLRTSMFILGPETSMLTSLILVRPGDYAPDI
jgi:hypothetical protein